MKKVLLYSFLSMICILAYGQNFSSAQQIRNYLASNIIQLDPIEGEYDAEMVLRTDSPNRSDWRPGPGVMFIVKAYGTQYVVYYFMNNKVGQHQKIKIESIGTTNAYRIYWANSSTRAIITDNVRLKFDIELTSTDAKDMANDPSFKYRMIMSYDLIKKYPTGEMYTNASRRQIEEETKSWTGTGFALNSNYVVTNYHVVENAKTITLTGVNGNFTNRYPATVTAIDKNNDLALLKLNGNACITIIPYSVKTTTSDVGEEIFVLGYPLTATMGDEIKLTTGVISSKSGFQGDVSLYQISAPIQPGNSGGPLFDSKGNVIGIVSAKHLGAENVGYAIKASYLRNLVESAASTSILPQTNRVTSPNLSGKVKTVKNFIYYIECKR